MQIKATGGRELYVDAPRSGTCRHLTGRFARANAAAAGVRLHPALYPVQLDAAGSGASAHFIPHIGDPDST
jgi:hypothetical protein